MSEVKSQEEFIEQPQTERPMFEDVKDFSQNTEAPNIEPQNRESFITEKNDNPTTSNTEIQNNEQSTATSTNIQNIDDWQRVTNTETTSTVSLTESPRTENIMELSNVDVSNTQTSYTESSTTGSPYTENKQDLQNSETSSTLPQNSSLSNKESLISEASNQQIKEVERNTSQIVNEKPVLTQTNARNNTNSIERPNIVFIVADDLVKQLFIYYIHVINS